MVISGCFTQSLSCHKIECLVIKNCSGKNLEIHDQFRKNSSVDCFNRIIEFMMKRSLLTLRDYQKECIDVTMAYYEKGITRMAVSLPVGSGKTVVFSNLIKRLQCVRHGKTLILAHRQELLSQAYKQCRHFMPEARISFDQGVQTPDVNSDIIIAVIKSLKTIEY